MSTLRMAWRNIWRNKRRTLVTIAAMSLALLVEVTYSSLVTGYLTSMERNILDFELGDIQIHAEGYRTDPSIYNAIEQPGELMGELDAAGYSSSARLLGAGLAAAGDASAGAIFRGVDPERDRKVSMVWKHVEKGRWLDVADPHGVVIGKKLARTLDIGPGDEIVVLSQGADGSMANDLYTVRGVLAFIGDAVDRSGIYMTEDAYRALFVFPEGAHQIMVRTPEGADLAASGEEVASIAGDLDTRTWKELMPTIASMLESTQGIMWTFFLVIYVAIAIMILNAMLMAVFERIREFGVLKALGVGPGKVLGLIVLESLFQTLIAVAVGVLAAIPTGLYLGSHGIDMTRLGGGMSIQGVAWDPVWRAQFGPESFVGPLVMLFFIVGVAIAYPALKAALIRPVEAIHHQ